MVESAARANGDASQENWGPEDVPAADAHDIEKPLSGDVAAEVEAMRSEVEAWRTQSADWKDQYLRSVAEFANFRKRLERERQQQTLNVSMDVLKKVLPVMDDLDRALHSVPSELDGATWVQGVAMIAHKLHAVLTDFGVKDIEALGKPFDPAFHYSLMREESAEYPPGTVMEELQKGYLLGGQVLRPTMVKISAGLGSQESVDS